MILCCGEALIDMLPHETADGTIAFVPHAGGSVFNSAIALGRLGAPAGLFCGLSGDRFGIQLQDALSASGVDTRFTRVSNRPCTLAFVDLADGQASYLFYDEGTAGRMLTQNDLPTLGNDVGALLFGGISLIPEPCGSAYESLMRREHARRVTMLDPNLRPAFITDRQSHEARLRRMAASADIVKVSEDDLAWFGESGDMAEVAARWLAGGVQLFIVTHGRDGASAFQRGRSVSVAGRDVAVADTVGAGDTFNAGLLAALDEAGLLSKPSIAALDEDQLRAAVEFAVLAASVTVSRAGANPPWRHEIPPARSIPA